MNAVVNLRVKDKFCGDCLLPVWEENPNGWAWTCPLFETRLTNRYWSSDRGWKQMRMQPTNRLHRCGACVDATDRAEGLELEPKGP